MIVSVVSGTYNRLDYLKHMVDSVRKSIGVGIPYEIVLVDGGSTDGTQDWCKSQPDVVLIEQYTLLGAVKAFNAGAYAARGKYVILANDDISFIDESILCALSFMEDNQDVGIGCFYQDRRGWQWHVEQMSAVTESGTPTTAYYGQVCIVRKWLGDRVGWWGDYLRTYGGDNELSCNVLELGYKILPIPCAKIHDYTPQDDLRTRNNEVKPVNNQHPDTYAWLQKWTRNGKLGPIVRSSPIVPNSDNKSIRVLYLPIYEPGHVLQKSTKHGLRDALARSCMVLELDYLAMDIGAVYDAACAFDPHLILTQLHSGDSIYHSMIVELRNMLDPAVMFVNWNGDYHPETLFSDAYILLMRRFDLVGVVTTSVEAPFDAAGIRWFYWQIGYEEASAKGSNATPVHDVLFLGNGYSKDRFQLASVLKGMRGINVGIYGSWPNNQASGSNLYDFDAGARLYSKCKIAIGDSQWPHAAGFVSNRLFQAMSAGAFLLHQHFDGMEELLGLRDGVNIAVWESLSDLENKIKYYLAHPDERRNIAEAGTRHIRSNHSFDNRVRELFEELAVVRSERIHA
jgi:glycosyltransferase involved in cell wall biosynthesis